MTITEFLMARIAEDEALATSVRSAQLKDVADGLYKAESVEPSLALWSSDGNFGQPALYADPARTLAECEAKRVIVTVAYELESFDFSNDGSYAHVARHQNAILRVLAAVYADHPDYQQEWAS